MLIGGRNIATRTLAMGIGGLLLVLAILFGVQQCDKRRDRAAQTRVERSQAEAQSKSAEEAINTVAKAGEREAASEGQSRQAEQDIRGAEGASDPVKPAVRDAGIKALCKRSIYANDPRCRRP